MREPLLDERGGAREPRDEPRDEPAAAARAGAAWTPHGRPLVVVPRARRRAGRAWRAPAALLSLAAMTAWWLARTQPLVPAGAAGTPWVLEIEAAGPWPTSVLVFGGEAGIQLVRARAEGSGRGDRIALPAPAGEGNVWMVSLGRSPLFVRAARADDAEAVRFTAHGRVVEVIERPSGSGVRTW